MNIAVDVVVLRDGPTVPLTALRFLWELEERGFAIREDDPHLVITPGSQLTDDDRAIVHRYRDDLIALVAYVDGHVLESQSDRVPIEEFIDRVIPAALERFSSEQARGPRSRRMQQARTVE
jgi:hypothetical protein